MKLKQIIMVAVLAIGYSPEKIYSKSQYVTFTASNVNNTVSSNIGYRVIIRTQED